MQYRERRIWYYQCRSCGKKRRKTHTRSKAKEAVCTLCLRSKGIPEQAILFDGLGSEAVPGLRGESQNEVRKNQEVKV